jgi:hypothetical protein
MSVPHVRHVAMFPSLPGLCDINHIGAASVHTPLFVDDVVDRSCNELQPPHEAKATDVNGRMDRPSVGAVIRARPLGCMHAE